MNAAIRVRLALFALIGAIAVTYSGARYAQLTDYVHSTDYSVRVDLPSSGGLFTGSEVTYRGVHVGEVDDISLTSRGVRAELRIEKSVHIPSDVTASVHNRSAVGEQYLDLVPAGAPADTYLSDGSVIPASRTETPVPEEVLLTNLDAFVESVDRGDLRAVVQALGTGLDGAGADLQQILDSSNIVLTYANKDLPATRSLIRDARIVLGTQSRHRSDLQSFSRSLSLLSHTLSARDPQVRGIIGSGGSTAHQLSRLIVELSPLTPRLLSATTTVMATLGANLAGLEQALVAFPESLAAAQAGVRDGRAQFTLATTPSPASCQRGYIPPDQWRSTHDLRVAPPRYDLHCGEPGKVWRGSAHAP